LLALFLPLLALTGRGGGAGGRGEGGRDREKEEEEEEEEEEEGSRSFDPAFRAALLFSGTDRNLRAANARAGGGRNAAIANVNSAAGNFPMTNISVGAIDLAREPRDLPVRGYPFPERSLVGKRAAPRRRRSVFLPFIDFCRGPYSYSRRE